MKIFKSFLFNICFLGGISLMIFTACKEDVKEPDVKGDAFEIDDDYYDFQGFSLVEYDIPFMIMLPDETANIGASTLPEVIHTENDFKWELNVGPNFNLIIDDWGDYTDMVKSKKKELSELNFYKINYLIDEKDFILYEQELKVEGSPKASSEVGVPHKSYHVYAQKIIDGVTYVFRSHELGHKRVIIEMMAKSIKSLRPLTNK
jgi:hypothetical protein